MEQFDSSEEASSRVLEQQQRNDEQQSPSCAAELIEASLDANSEVLLAIKCRERYVFLATDGDTMVKCQVFINLVNLFPSSLVNSNSSV